MKKIAIFIIFVFVFISLCFSNIKEFNIKLRFTSKAIFNNPVNIKAYKNRIYVLDSKAKQVKILSLKGETIKSFGREGEGPGEFIKPTSFDIYNDNIFVLDRNRVTIFDLEGNLIKNFRTNNFFSFIIILNKKILLSDIMIIPKTPFTFCFYNISGKIVPKQRRKNNKQINLSVSEMMFHMKYLFKIDDKNFAYIDNYSKKPEHKITIVNINGKTIRKIYLNNKIFKNTFFDFKGKRIYGIFKNGFYHNGYYFLQSFRYKKELFKGKFDIEPSNMIYVFNKNGVFKGNFSFPNYIKIFTYYKDRFFVIDSNYELKIYKQKTTL